MWTLTLALFAALLACGDQDEAVYSCQVTLSEVAPAEVLPGETVVLTGKPMSTAADSALWIGGTSARSPMSPAPTARSVIPARPPKAV